MSHGITQAGRKSTRNATLRMSTRDIIEVLEETLDNAPLPQGADNRNKKETE